MKNVTAYILLLIIMLFMPLCASAKIKIALIAPRSGDYKIWGDELLKGAQTAIDEINKNGGVKGKKLELETLDDPCSENLSLSMAQMLSMRREKPALVIGPYCSDGFAKTAKVYSQARIFQITPAGLTLEDSLKSGNDTHRIGGIKEQAGTDFFEFYNQRTPGVKVAAVYDDKNPNMKKTVNIAEETFRRHGKGSIFEKFSFEQDLETVAEQINKSGIKMVFIVGKPKKIAKMIKYLKQKDKDIQIVTGRYLVGDSLREYAAEYLDNVWFMGLPPVENEPEFAEQIVNLRLQGIELDSLNIDGFAAVKTWETIVREAGSLKYENIIKAARKNKKHDLWRLSSDNATDFHYTFYQYKDGEFLLFEE